MLIGMHKLLASFSVSRSFQNPFHFFRFETSLQLLFWVDEGESGAENESMSPCDTLILGLGSALSLFCDSEGRIRMLKLVRTLPKVLKYLRSDKAQDARLYILSLQFWLGGSPDNLVNFLKMISGSYVPALKGVKLKYSNPVLYLDSGIWHPLAPCMYDDMKEYLNWYATRRDANEKLKSPNAPVIGLVLQRSHIVTGDESHYVVVIMKLEARGAKIIPIFTGEQDFSGPVDRYFIDPITKKPFVNSVVSLTGFALVGGPARQDHPRAIEALTKLDVPYIVALPLVFQTTEEWLNSTLGLHPIQVALQVALPELDGGMEPIVFSGRDPRSGKSHALRKRVE